MRVEWTRNARPDLDDIFKYISKDSNIHASNFLAKLVRSTRPLSSFPNLGKASRESDDRTIRQLLFQSYRVIYRIETDVVRILAVVHSARDISVPAGDR